MGGGLPVGVYGGRADLMKHISPLGVVYQAELSGNPLATAAICTLNLLKEPGFFDRIVDTSKSIEEGLNHLIKVGGHRAVVQRAGTMFTLFFSEGPVKNFDDAQACDHARFGRFHQAMIREGVYLPPSGYEACFVSAQHTEVEVNHILRAAEIALNESA